MSEKNFENSRTS